MMNPYDKYAQQWAEMARNNKIFSHSYIEKPAMLSKISDLQGKSVLCVGCGSGEECKELSDRGASVVGIDNSEALIKIARQSFPEIEFHVMDMEQIDLPENSFDFVYSSLTLHYKELWDKTLQSIAQVMKPDATLLFSTIHPISWSAEIINDSQLSARLLGYEEIDDRITIHGDYFSPKHIHDKWWGFFDVDLYSKPLTECFAEIREAGFEVLDFVEPRAIAEGKAVDPLQYARYRKLPLFMIFELKKR